MERPIFSLNREMGFGPMDVDEGYQDGGHLHLRSVEDVRDEVSEVALLGTSVGPATGGGGSAESVVNHFRCLVDQMV